MSKELNLPVGLADSELEGYRRSKTDVVVEIQAWNESHVRISFHDVIALRDSLAGSISGLVEDSPGSGNTLREALARNFETVPAAHPYHVYSFLNLDGDPSLEVVASSYEATLC